MEERNRHWLEEAIGQMKSKVAPEKIWDAIRDELEDEDHHEKNHEALQKAVAALPNLTFEQDIFDQIIPQEAKPKNRLNIAIRKWSVAASIFLVICLGLLYGPNQGNEKINISYSEQTIELNTDITKELTSFHEQDEVLSFIKSNCKAFETECNRDEFKELLDQYIQLESDRKELLEVIHQNKEETQLVQYLVRLEKKKTQLGKQLMQTFI